MRPAGVILLALVASPAVALPLPTITGPIPFPADAGDAFVFHWTDADWGVVFSPDLRAYDRRPWHSTEYPFVMTHSGEWIFETKRYDGATWTLAPGLSHDPAEVRTERVHGGTTFGVREESHGVAFRAVSEQRGRISLLLAAEFARDHPAPESLLVHMDGTINGQAFSKTFLSSGEGIGGGVAIEPLVSTGTLSPNIRIERIDTRYIFHLMVADASADLRVVAYDARTPAEFDVAYYASAPAAHAYAFTDDVITWSGADAGTSVGGVSPPGAVQTTLDLPPGFIGFAKSHGDAGQAVGPNGETIELRDGHLFVDPAPGPWKFHIDRSLGIQDGYYLTGIPSLSAP